ncbi:carbon starvation protein [Austwickia chelonae]|uniref:Carbon starvation protein n=1 Tax=Austwickia chelonae NBRC 105200 TaxID=1184607 RepID=K6VKS9_9MICO|nr:carbon starvation CstA family protein [Austwickia chelonae]GAB77354.1 carbon starvation protein [Austwickia chelonae NBRC 105200]SEW08507.1 carbon starvation protein [Austwickia chelonae]
MSVDTVTEAKVRNDPALPPIAVNEPPHMTRKTRIYLAICAVLAGIGWIMLALVRGEEVNARWFVFAAVGSYLIALQFYARYIERKILQPDDARATPAEKFDNGKDFMPTDRRVLFGHHFAAIAGAGPLVGPILASQMGYLPGTLWIVLGVVLAGGVQDYMVLHFSMRRNGRSLGQMAREELGPIGGWAAIIGVLTIMIMIIAVLGVVMIGALAESAWALFSIACTIPIALFMGVYLRYLRPGAVNEISLIGVILLVVSIVAGKYVADSSIAHYFILDKPTLAVIIALYGFAASVLPVWLLLAPRDYLSTFMKVGTIVLLAVGIVVVGPTIQMPAVTTFAETGTGPAFAGGLFPFLFITIACGAISGFHALISSGTTPKLIEKEKQARIIGYGGMLTESFVAIMALVAACTLDQHLYFAMNAPGGLTGAPDPTKAAAYTNGLGLVGPGGAPLSAVDASMYAEAAKQVGESTIISRTGGAPTLAMGMADVMHQTPLLNLLGNKAFWYHFAVMFEALFILTTIDAGTRVARFMFSDTIAHIPGMKRFADPSWRVGAWVCSAIVVLGWGGILYMGVTDPLGGINTLFPLFGISNQLLACIALCVVFAIVCKKGLFKYAWIPGLPLFGLLAVTQTASFQKIFSSDVKLGYNAVRQAAIKAKESGAQSFQTAKTPEQIDQVIFNSGIQLGLSIVYALLVLIVFATTMWVVWKAVRAGGMPTSEEEATPSKIFAPASFIPTPLEKEVLAEWKAAGLDPTPTRGHH